MAKTNVPASRFSRSLHLQHRQHTGRLLHHKHTSYRGLAVLLGVAGLFMVGLNVLAHTAADELRVYASIMAPLPTTAPVITSPTDGSNVSKSSQIVEGTCPHITPHVVIVITDNGTLAGSAPCDDDDRFTLTIIITPGVHTLVATPYTITNEPGPASDPVTITYTTPAPVTSSAAAALNAESKSGSPLVVTIDEPFIVFGPAQDAVWTGTITGGRLPYHVHINWGDDSFSDYTITKSGHQQFAHRYRSMQSHTIILRVTDADGRGVTQDYAAVTPYRAPVPIFATTIPRAPFKGSVGLGLYGAYLLLIAIFGYSWIRTHRRRSFAYATVPIGAARGKRLYAAAKRKHRRKNR